MAFLSIPPWSDFFSEDGQRNQKALRFQSHLGLISSRQPKDERPEGGPFNPTLV